MQINCFLCFYSEHKIKGDENMVNNLEIRNTIKQHRLRYWEVAEQIGISDGRLSVWLRTPLTDNRKKRVEKAIDQLLNKVSI